MTRGLPSGYNSIRNLGWQDALVDLGNGQLSTSFTGYEEHDTFVRTLTRFSHRAWPDTHSTSNPWSLERLSP